MSAEASERTGSELGEAATWPAFCLGVALSTVSAVLSRIGLGSEFVHVCVDDATRLAHVEGSPMRRPLPPPGSCVTRSL